MSDLTSIHMSCNVLQLSAPGIQIVKSTTMMNDAIFTKTCSYNFTNRTDNRRFPRSMRSQGERPGCGSHVKRVDHGDAFDA